ncbi:MAG: DpnI domain-containing protein [Candidatus Tyrphobacter sp.]
MDRRPTTWKTLVREVIDRLPRTFTLHDVAAQREYFAKHYPNNRFIEAKIRQSLQILRDQGLIWFVRPGVYERTTASQPVFSPFFDPSVAEGFVSKSQIARLTVETWAEQNLYCLSCDADELAALPANTQVADLECLRCERRYQLKSKDGRFGGVITGAAYAPLVRAVRERRVPDYVLVEYDKRFSIMVFVSALPGRYISEACIVPRKTLGASARRAGWQGCTIDVRPLGPYRVSIVEPAGRERAIVRSDWAKASRDAAPRERRGQR